MSSPNNALMCLMAESNLPLVAGIVNATGDSFSEGILSSPNNAVERAMQLLDDGADMLDIGGESTRPGSTEVFAEEECQRVLPVIDEILRLRPNVVLSLDTRHSLTAKRALEHGVSIINDVSMLRFDESFSSVVAEHGATLILCHSRGVPSTMQNPKFLIYPHGVVSGVIDELQTAAASARKAGVNNIWFDPGFGFSKNLEQTKELMRNLEKLKELGPVFVGVSRKSFIGAWTGEKNPSLRSGGTLAAELFLVNHGADIVRTHDVRLLRQALLVRKELSFF